MRIISGRHRGKRIIAPKKLPVRPTTDRVKESLFNILNNHFNLEKVRVLDLYAGTGNISYEFASRGAPAIVSVDAHGACVQFIAKTAIQLEAPIKAIRQAVVPFLKRNTERFDIVFADPPYDIEAEDLKVLVEETFQQNTVNPEGWLVLEHSKHIDLQNISGFKEQRRYGSSVLSIFEAETPE